jgi:hypothetical protein
MTSLHNGTHTTTEVAGEERFGPHQPVWISISFDGGFIRLRAFERWIAPKL